MIKGSILSPLLLVIIVGVPLGTHTYFYFYSMENTLFSTQMHGNLGLFLSSDIFLFSKDTIIYLGVFHGDGTIVMDGVNIAWMEF